MLIAMLIVFVLLCLTMGAAAGPGASNVLVPTYDPGATGALQVEFTRRANTFPITRYAQITPVKDRVFYYLRIDNEEAVRIVNEGDYDWPDGTDRPRGSEARHDFVDARTRRKAYDFMIPGMAREQARWDVVASNGRMKAQLAMTHRTLRMITKLTTTGNWTASINTDTATNIAGQIGGSSTSNKYIQKIVEFCVDAIHKNTGGAVGPDSIIMVMGPDVARAIAQSPEVQSFLVNWGIAAAFLKRGGDQSIFDRYGLLSGMFGVSDVVVENAVRVTSRKKADGTQGTRAFMLSNSLLFVSRPGGLIGVEGAPTFSTATIFAHEDMTVETAEDSWNRRMMGSVVDDVATELTAPLSGYYVRSVLT